MRLEFGYLGTFADGPIDTAPAVGFAEGVQALIRGFGGREKKPFYIHTSGVACLVGEVNDPEKVWDDVKDIEEIHSQPETRTHRKTDKVGSYSRGNLFPLTTSSSPSPLLMLQTSQFSLQPGSWASAPPSNIPSQ